MPYDGGKAGAGIAQTIINQIPPHEIYIEPFLGDGAVIRRKKPARRNVGIEIDGQVLAAWIGDELPGLELHCCDGIEWLRHAFHLYRLPSFLLSAARPGLPAIAARKRVAARAAKSSVVSRAENPAKDPAAVSPIVAAEAFIYADPPYLRSTRRNKGKMYRHELSDADHLKLLATLKALPCMVAVSGYYSEMYAAELAGWRTLRFWNQTRVGRAEEWLWMNYPEPVGRLHDARFLGRNKRERERIRRRVRNWTAALRRVSPLERQAIVDAVAESHLAGGPQ